MQTTETGDVFIFPPVPLVLHKDKPQSVLASAEPQKTVKSVLRQESTSIFVRLIKKRIKMLIWLIKNVALRVNGWLCGVFFFSFILSLRFVFSHMSLSLFISSATTTGLVPPLFGLAVLMHFLGDAFKFGGVVAFNSSKISPVPKLETCSLLKYSDVQDLDGVLFTAQSAAPDTKVKRRALVQKLAFM